MGYSVGSNHKEKQQSSTAYPAAFMNLFENRYGRGLSLGDVAGLLPQEQSLFGGGPIGYGSGGYGGGGGGAPDGGGGPGGQAANTQRVPYAQISALVAQQYPDQPQIAANVNKAILDQMRATGVDPNVGVTPQELAGYNGAGQTRWVRSVLPGLAQNQIGGPSQITQTGNMADLSGLDVNSRIRQLFTPDPNMSATPWQFSNVPTITAPTIGASEAGYTPGFQAPTAAAQQAQIAPGGFDRYEQALYESAFNPQSRALLQRGAIDDRRLQAELAQSGLASSGAGLGQVQQQRLDRSRDLQSLSADAATRATAQRYGAEQTQEQFNAQQRQQTELANQQTAYGAMSQRFGADVAREQFNARQRQEAALANAGFSMDAQKTNAANVLAGDTLRSDNYLKTIGLNQQGANVLRSDFLNLLGIAEADLKRISDAQRDNLGLLLNNWLQQGALLGNLGQRSSGTNKGGGASGGGLSITAASSAS